MSRAARVVTLGAGLLAAACGSEAESFAPSDVSASASPAVATVVNVTWTTSDASTGYVSFGTTPSLGMTTTREQAAATKHTQSLVGLMPGTTYYYRVVTWDGRDAGRSPLMTVRTGALPGTLPALTVTGDGASDAGFDELLLLPITTTQAVVAVVSPSTGSYLWYHLEDSDRTVTRARFSRDKTSVLYNAIGPGDGATSAIVRVPLDGSNVTSTPVPGLGQDFVELASGHYVAIAADTRPTTTGATLTGDKLVDVDPASGTLTPVASTWDCYDPTTTPGDGPSGTWTGANALTLDEGDSETSDADDSFYLGLRYLSTIVKIPRATGKCELAVGAAQPTLAFAAGSEAFKHQGGFVAHTTSLAVLDADGAPASSRVLEYTLDPTANTATQSWAYTPNPALHVTALGLVSSLTGNRRLANWGSAGRIEVVGDTGNVLWSLSAAAGTTFGYHVRATSLIDPENKP